MRVGDALRAHRHLLQAHQQCGERKAPVLRLLRHGLRDCDQGHRSERQRGLDLSSVRQGGGQTADVSRHCQTLRR